MCYFNPSFQCFNVFNFWWKLKKQSFPLQSRTIQQKFAKKPASSSWQLGVFLFYFHCNTTTLLCKPDFAILSNLPFSKYFWVKDRPPSLPWWDGLHVKSKGPRASHLNLIWADDLQKNRQCFGKLWFVKTKNFARKLSILQKDFCASCLERETYLLQNSHLLF